MDDQILSRLSAITQEEQRILDGETVIDRKIYMQGSHDIINSKKLLSAGKLITVRPHTRFIDFPKHTHDYVEMIYMCCGKTTHIVNGQPVLLKSGELLLLNQSATHEVRRAETGDIAVNFIILPEFFTETLNDIGEEETPLRRFLIDCLCRQNSGAGYLHFQVAGVKYIQNLVENLLFTLLYDNSSKRRISSMTMSLLFLQLTAHTDTLSVITPVDAAVLDLLRYADANYVSGSLADAAELLHFDVAWLSRELKRKTGKTFTQIVQEKRLAQAAFLLRNTDAKVSDISIAVGYENISFFHRLFSASFGCSPKKYRDGV